jgi:hypothetical protein
LVLKALRLHRIDGHGEAWWLLQSHHDEVPTSVADELMGG